MKSITCLVPASTSTNWWQDYYSEGDVFCFVDHRIQFIGAGSNGASFANVIVVFGADNLPEAYFSKLDDLGTVLGRTKIDNRSLLEF